MLKAIIYKEWLKTRGVFLIGLVLSLCIAAFDVLSMNRVATLKGVEHIWQIMLMKDNVFVTHLMFVPLVVGIGLGLAQMLPEMAQKRFKLTLHLPYPQNKMILAMMAIGIVEFLAIAVVTTILVAVYDSGILVPELVSRVVLTMIPWFFSGIAAYFFTTSICIEGCKLQKVALALIGIGFVSLFYLIEAPEAYNGVLALFLVVSLLCALLVYRAVYRFKEGRQD